MDCEIDDDESTCDAHDNHACELLSPVTVCADSILSLKMYIEVVF